MSGVAPLFPCGDFGDEARVAFDATAETLAGEDVDLDLNHVEPTGVIGNVVELDAAQQAPRFLGREGLI
jgi:hypothetical protein